jgi:hypothetical protein
MSVTGRMMLVLTMASVLASCMASTQTPPPTAFQKNVGPGSSADGIPTTANGSVGRPGDPIVPGVSSAGPIVR